MTKVYFSNPTRVNNKFTKFEFTVNRNSKRYGTIKTPKEIVIGGGEAWIQDSPIVIDGRKKDKVTHIEDNKFIIVECIKTGIRYKIFDTIVYRGTRYMVSTKCVKLN
jgi:predicted nucleic-acid-binding Zn-ribbon protein